MLTKLQKIGNPNVIIEVVNMISTIDPRRHGCVTRDIYGINNLPRNQCIISAKCSRCVPDGFHLYNLQ